MKKLISLALSLAMLLTTISFAAPTAVVTESAQEIVVENINNSELVQAHTALTQLESDGAAAEAKKILEYGVEEFYENFENIDTTLNYSLGANDTLTFEDGTAKLSGTSGAWYGFTFPSRTVNLETGKTYTLMMDVLEGTPTQIQYVFGGNVTSGALSLVEGNTYKAEKSFDTAINASSVKIVRTNANNVTIKLDNIGIFWKPAVSVAAPMPEYNTANGTATVTYNNGLHEDIKAALGISGAIDGVTNVEINGNSVTYTLTKDCNVVLPSLVNGDGSAVYSSQTLKIDTPDVNTLKYGVREAYANFVANPIEIANTVTANASGNGIDVSFSGMWQFVTLIDDSITYKLDNTYAHVVDMTPTYADRANMLASIGGAGWNNGTFNQDWRENYYNYYENETTNFVRTFTAKEELTKVGVGIASNGTVPSDVVTVQKLALYRKPTATAAASVASTNAKAKTVTVSYPNGVYDKAVDALTAYPETVSGVTSVSQPDQNSLVFTFSAYDAEITIPALVNASGTATYNEVTAKIEAPDVNTVKYGVREAYEDFAANPVELSATGHTVTKNADGKGIDVQFNAGWNWVTLINQAISFSAGNTYTHIVDVEYSLESMPVNWMYPSIITSSNGCWWTLSNIEHDYRTNYYSSYNGEYISDDSFARAFTVSADTSTTGIGIGVGTAPASEVGAVTVKTLGLYRKPTSDASALSVKATPTTLAITYPDGIYDKALYAILVNPDIVGANNASYADNTLTLTSQNVSAISVPGLVNAAMNATYCEVKGAACPISTEKGIRTNIKDYGMGVRTVAKVHQSLRALYGDANVEYGTLVTLETILNNANLTSDGLTFEAQASGVNIISKASFGNGENKLHDIDGDYDFYSAAFVNIPKDKDSYKMNLVFRPYVKYTYNGVTNVVYGEPVTASPYSVATEIAASAENYGTDVVDYCNAIISFCDNGGTLPE